MPRLKDPDLVRFRPFAPYYAGWLRRQHDIYRMKVSSKGQVTLPYRLRQVLGLHRGDRIDLVETPDGFLLQKCRLDPTRLAPLREHVTRRPPGIDTLLHRHEALDPKLRA